MKRLTVIVLVIIGVFLAGCSVNPSEVSDKYAKEFASKIKYVKDKRTGICFAFVASRKTGKASSTGMGMTAVPCDVVGHMLVK